MKEFILDLWHAIERFFRVSKQTLMRMYDYAKFSRKSWDFDAQSVERYMEWKLLRIQKVMLNGYVDRTSHNSQKSLKTLKVCIRILKRLNDDDPYAFLFKGHTEKWGETKILREEYDSKNSTTTRATLIHEKCKDFKEDQQAFSERYAIYTVEARMTKRDRKLLYKLLEEYLPTWWD
jgi:uncharacterized protein with ATP-grasp and redox domains